jgi:hypothetical protein
VPQLRRLSLSWLLQKNGAQRAMANSRICFSTQIPRVPQIRFLLLRHELNHQPVNQHRMNGSAIFQRHRTDSETDAFPTLNYSRVVVKGQGIRARRPIARSAFTAG